MSISKHSINDFILFAVYSFAENNKKCTFQQLIKECFSLFPEVFCFSEYPNWPDARKLDRPLRALRKKKFIKGNPQTSFTLTPSGKKVAQEIAKTLRQKKLL